MRLPPEPEPEERAVLFGVAFLRGVEGRTETREAWRSRSCAYWKPPMVGVVTLPPSAEICIRVPAMSASQSE